MNLRRFVAGSLAFIMFNMNLFSYGTVVTEVASAISDATESKGCQTEHNWEEGEVTDATCAEKGEIEYICSECGETKTESIDKIDHDWEAGETTEATCAEEGCTEYTCSECGETKTETIDKTEDHNWEEGETTEATCAEEGSTEYTCSECGDTKTETIDKAEHKWEAGETTEATCAEEGSTEYICSVCGDTKTETIDKTEHNWEAGETTEATCAEEGKAEYACSVCGETKTETIDKLPHSWDEGNITTKATCAEEGKAEYACSVCGDTKTETIDKEEHNWEAGETTEATCTEEGKAEYTCIVCGDTKTETIDKEEHNWEAGETTEATCTEEGKAEYACSVCGDTKTETIDKEEHNWEAGETTEATCTEEGKAEYACSVCGATKTETIDKVEHNWNEGEITLNPTDTTEGIKTYTCSVCTEIKTEVIPTINVGDGALDVPSNSDTETQEPAEGTDTETQEPAEGTDTETQEPTDGTDTETQEPTDDTDTETPVVIIEPNGSEEYMEMGEIISIITSFDEETPVYYSWEETNDVINEDIWWTELETNELEFEPWGEETYLYIKGTKDGQEIITVSEVYNFDVEAFLNEWNISDYALEESSTITITVAEDFEYKGIESNEAIVSFTVSTGSTSEKTITLYDALGNVVDVEFSGFDATASISKDVQVTLTQLGEYTLEVIDETGYKMAEFELVDSGLLVEIDNSPKTAYFLGDALDITEGTLKLGTAFGSTATISGIAMNGNSNVTLSNVDMSVSGEQKITVTYTYNEIAYRTTYNIFVSDGCVIFNPNGSTKYMTEIDTVEVITNFKSDIEYAWSNLTDSTKITSWQSLDTSKVNFVPQGPDNYLHVRGIMEGETEPRTEVSKCYLYNAPLTRIEVTTVPAKTVYAVTDTTLNLLGGELTLYYEMETETGKEEISKTIGFSEFAANGVTISNLGENIVVDKSYTTNKTNATQVNAEIKSKVASTGWVERIVITHEKSKFTASYYVTVNTTSYANGIVNAPDVAEGMLPIKYVEGKYWSESDWVEIEPYWMITTETDTNWYSYKSGVNKWANVMLRDDIDLLGYDNTTTVIQNLAGKIVEVPGSMFVWIPRYNYTLSNGKVSGIPTDSTMSVSSLTGDNKTGIKAAYLDITWVQGTSGQAHSAFSFGGTELSGFWMAKFEASNNGDDLVKVVPDVQSWNKISVEQGYQASQDMMDSNKEYYQIEETIIDSHLTKNNEWGAVALLTIATLDSGKTFTGAIPYINNYYVDGIKKTGYSGADQDTVEAESESELDVTTFAWNTEKGQKASTTHNIYGVYDMSGGLRELVAGYITPNETVDNTVYWNDVSNYLTDTTAGYAMTEVIVLINEDDDYELLDQDIGKVLDENTTFVLRGGDYAANNDAGIFNFAKWSNLSAVKSKVGFRPVIAMADPLSVDGGEDPEGGETGGETGGDEGTGSEGTGGETGGDEGTGSEGTGGETGGDEGTGSEGTGGETGGDEGTGSGSGSGEESYTDETTIEYTSNQYAKVGDTLSVTITSTKALELEDADNFIITTGGDEITGTPVVNGYATDWTIKYKFDSGDTSGKVEITLVDAGNVSTEGEVIFKNINDGNIIELSASTALTNTKVQVNVTINSIIPTEVIKYEKDQNDISYFASNGEEISNKFLVSENGTYYVYAKDYAGNEYINSIEIRNIDKDQPTLQVTSINSNNAKTNYAKNGDTVTIKMIASEEITKPNVTINGREIASNKITTSDNINYTVTYQIPSNESSLPEGLIAVSISNYKDEAGNFNDPVTTTEDTNGNTVIYDRTKVQPFISTPNTYSTHGEEIYYTVSFSDINLDEATLDIRSVDFSIETTGTVTGDIQVVDTDDILTKKVYVKQIKGEGTFYLKVLGVNGSNHTPVQDMPGNKTATLESTDIIAVDTVQPSFTENPSYEGEASISIESNNDANTDYATNGDTITLTLKAREKVTTPIVTIMGRTATVTTSDNINFTATYQIPSEEIALLETQVWFEISGYDEYSTIFTNAGKTHSETTDGSKVIYDKTKPTGSISAPSISEITATTTNEATYTITYSDVNFDVSTLKASNVVLVANGVTATKSVSGTGNTRVVKLSNISGTGTIGISINAGTAKDMAGNLADALSTSELIKVDTPIPTLSGVKIYSNNTDTTYAKNGNTISLEFVSSEEIQTPVVEIMGRMASVTNTSNDQKTFKAIYEIPAGENTLTQGNVEFSINYQDIFGNVGAEVTTTNDSSSVYYDRTNPTVTFGTNGNQILSQTHSTKVTLADANSGLLTQTYYYAWANNNVNEPTYTETFTNGSTITGSGFTGTYYLWIKSISDKAGNESGPVISNAFNFDNSIPAIEIQSIKSNNSNIGYAKNGDVITIYMVSSEEIYTKPTVKVGGKTATVNWTSGSTTGTAIYTISSSESSMTQGILEIEVSGYKDIAENEGETVTSTLGIDGSNVHYDRTAPVIEAKDIVSETNSHDVTKKSHTVNVAVTDTTSGLKNNIIYYAWSINSPSVWTSASLDASGNATIDGAGFDGTYYLWIKTLEDKAGNTSSYTSESFSFDNTRPIFNEVKISSNNDNNTSYATRGDTVTISMVATENIVTPPTVTIGGKTATVTISNLDKTRITAELAFDDSTYDKVPEGNLTIRLSGYKDFSENEGELVIQTTDGSYVIYDRTNPYNMTISAINNANSVALTGNASDNTYIEYYAWTTTSDEPASWTKVTTVKDLSVGYGSNITTAGTYYFHTKDIAGNTSYTSKEIYQVTYNTDGGSTAPSAQYKADGVELKLSSTVPTKTGYTFAGWKAEGTNVVENIYQAGSIYEQNVNTTLKAQWTTNQYKVNFDAVTNGGVASYQSKYVTYGKTYGYVSDSEEQELPIATKEGYTFTGWYTVQTNGTEATKITKASPVTITADQTLYAQFKQNTYTVTYNSNKPTLATANISGTTADSGHTYDVESNLTENAYELSGWTFVGWNTKADGTGTGYQDKESVKNLTATDGAIVTLYAQWKQGTYKVTFDATTNGGTLIGIASKFVNYDETYGELPTAKKEVTGYIVTFSGWYDAASGGNKIEPSTAVTITANQTLYAQFTQTADTVQYKVEHYLENANDTGYSLYKSETKYTRTETVIDLLSEITTENDLLYVAKVKDASGNVIKDYTNGTSDSTKSATVLADGSLVIKLYYTRATYTLTLEKDSNIQSVTGAGTYKWGQNVTISATENDDTAEYDYKWLNWTSSNIGLIPETSQQSPTIMMPKSDATLKANGTAEAKTYTVTFVADPGTCYPTTKKVTVGQPYGDLPAGNYSLEGYIVTFSGWLDENNNEIQPSTIVSIARDHTLHAADYGIVAASVSYTVNHYLENAEATAYVKTISQEKYAKTASTITLANEAIASGDFAYANYSYGQVDGSTVTTTTVLANGSLVIDLYYTRNTYALTLNKGSYIASVTGAGTYRWGQSVDISAVLETSEAGYTNKWVNWTSNNTSLLGIQSAQSTTIAMPKGAVTLTANGTRDAITVSYTVNHYLENANDTNYTLISSGTKVAITGTTVTLVNEKVASGDFAYANYSYGQVGGSTVTTTTVLGDGSLVINLYYTRNTYALTLNKGNYIASVSGAGTYKWGQSVDISATLSTSEAGYTNKWVNWTSNNTSLLGNQSAQSTTIVMPKSAITLTANGTRDTIGVAYTVNHHLENPNDVNYTIILTETKSAITGTSITLANEKLTSGDLAYASYKEGKVGGSVVTTTTVLGNGSLVIDLYYTRNTYSLTLSKGNYIASVSGAGTYKWGQSVNISATLEENASGWFNKWVNWTSSNTSLLANQSSQNTTITMSKGAVTLTANGTRDSIYKDTLSLRFNPNGGTISGGDAEQNYELTGDVTSATFTINTYASKTGYEFLGWSTDISATEASYTSGSSITITSDTTLYAVYKAINVGFKVNHYLENANDTGYTKASEENVSGLSGASVTLSAQALTTGDFAYATYSYGQVGGTTVQVTTVEGDGSTVIDLYYTRNTYTLTLNKGSYIASVSGGGIYKWGQSVSISATLSASETGYQNNWEDWTSSNTSLLADQSSQSTTITMPKGTVTLTANGSRERLIVSYTVKHWLENADDTGYTVNSEETKTGNVASTLTLSAEAKTINNSTYSYGQVGGSTVTTVTVPTDDSLVINLYYTRNTFELTLQNNGVMSMKASYKWGRTVSINATIGANYTWSGWYYGDGSLYSTTQNTTIVMPANAVTLNAVSTQKSYTVNHYLENANDTGYTLYSTETKTAEAETITLANDVTTIANSTYKEGKVGTTIATTASASDASASGINLYYTRNTFTLTLQNNGISVSEVDYKHGASVTINAGVATGYTWKGWYNGATLYNANQSATITMPTSALTLNAVSEAAAQILLSDVATVGAYVTYTPSNYSYTVKTSASGYASSQTYNPSSTTSWRVFSNDGTNIEIISTDSIGNLYLTGSTGYANAVQVLQDMSAAYVNSTYAESGRSLGYYDEKVVSSSGTLGDDMTETQKTKYKTLNTSSYPLNYNVSGFPYIDYQYYPDKTVLSDHGSMYHSSDEYVWLASRNVRTVYSNEWTYFDIRYMDTSGNVYYKPLSFVQNGDNYELDNGDGFGYGVRPIITLKTGITITEGSGTAEDPYIVNRPNLYTITYNANGGTGSMTSQIVTEGQAVNLTTNKFTRSDYIFLGWSTDATATTATYTNGQTITPTSDMTLYAVWGIGTKCAHPKCNQITDQECCDNCDPLDLCTICGSCYACAEYFCWNCYACSDCESGVQHCSNCGECGETRPICSECGAACEDCIGICYDCYYCVNCCICGLTLLPDIASVGDYVTYVPSSTSYTVPATVSGADSNQTYIPSSTTSWRVFSNDGENVEIISADILDLLTLGGVTGYINAVQTLNDLSMAYVNTQYAISGRSLGYSEEGLTDIANYKVINTTTYPVKYGVSSTFPYCDTQCTADKTTLANHGSMYHSDNDDGNGAWLASRSISSSGLFVMTLSTSDNVWSSLLGDVGLNGEEDVSWCSEGVRPIITLKSGLAITGGSGTSADPYIINTSNPSQYTVTYNANGGYGEMMPQSVTQGSSLTLNANTYEHHSKAFEGWATDATATTATYTNGQTITPTADMTLYAVWGDPPTLSDDWKENVVSDLYLAYYMEIVDKLENSRYYSYFDDIAVDGFTTYNADIDGTGEIKVYYNYNVDGEMVIVIAGNGASKIKAPENSSELFSGLSSVMQIFGLEMLDTSNVTDMSSMFSTCVSLESIDLSSFDTSKVTNMSSMFEECCSLTSLDVSGFNTSAVTNMSSMFYNLNLVEIDLTSFDTRNVTDMSYICYGSGSLIKVTLGPNFVLVMDPCNDWSFPNDTMGYGEVGNWYTEDGTLVNISNHSGTTTTYYATKPLSATLSVGDYVEYTPSITSYTVSTDASGYTSAQTYNPSSTTSWRVLSVNGGDVEIISTDSVGTLYLQGEAGYKNAVQTLNDMSAAYVNNSYATSGRSLGYYDEKVVDDVNGTLGANMTETQKANYKKISTTLSYGLSGFPYTEYQYYPDKTVLANHGSMYHSSEYVWLASRNMDPRASDAFYVRAMSNSGSISLIDDLYYVYSDGSTSTSYSGYGVRPIIKLKLGLEIAYGEGTEKNPYVLNAKLPNTDVDQDDYCDHCNTYMSWCTDCGAEYCSECTSNPDSEYCRDCQ